MSNEGYIEFQTVELKDENKVVFLVACSQNRKTSHIYRNWLPYQLGVRVANSLNTAYPDNTLYGSFDEFLEVVNKIIEQEERNNIKNDCTSN